MKKTLLLFFTFFLTGLFAQKSYNCYYLQEFKWNSKTSLYDLEVKQNTKTSFKIDEQKKTLTQLFEDGTSLVLPITSQEYKKNLDQTEYKTVSPANGYTFLYRVNHQSLTLEVLHDNHSTTTLLKKYLFKD